VTSSDRQPSPFPALLHQQPLLKLLVRELAHILQVGWQIDGASLQRLAQTVNGVID